MVVRVPSHCVAKQAEPSYLKCRGRKHAGLTHEVAKSFMIQRLFACVILCLLLGYSNAIAFIPANQSAPCDDWVPGDFDVDGDIDTDDFNFLQSCQTGASVPVSLSCKRTDLDVDNDVDM